MKISIIGLGFVGGAMYKCFCEKNKEYNKDYEIYGYDKYKNIGNLENCLDSDIIVSCLPTTYDNEIKKYDCDSTVELLSILKNIKYNGLFVIKSTVEPLFINNMSKLYNINCVHNPEFLTARTAFDDFNNQKHIVLGKSDNCDESKYKNIVVVYKNLFPHAMISEVSGLESECMKLFTNTFYAVKVQYFNELYLLCQKLDCNYENVKNIMLKNGWINPMHTNIPGPDGKLSYGGLCFPKDTNALLQFMKKNDSPHEILESCINERNKMRNDNNNITK